MPASTPSALLLGMDKSTVSGTLPESVFVMFQMTFAIITPALIIGGIAERARFSAVMLFSADEASNKMMAYAMVPPALAAKLDVLGWLRAGLEPCGGKGGGGKGGLAQGQGGDVAKVPAAMAAATAFAKAALGK